MPPPTYLSHDLTLVDTRIHVEEITGQPADPPTVLLLHGLTEDGPTQEAAALALADVGFRVLLPDAPGHGRSGLPPVFTPQHRAEVVIGVIESLCSGPVILQGQSMGGEAAALVAAQRPDLVAGVVLEDPPIRFEPPPMGAPDIMAHNKKWIGEMQELDHDGQVAWGQERMSRWSDFEIERWARAKERCNVNVFDLAATATYPDWPALLPRICAPVLLFRGDPTECIIDEATATEFVRLCPTTTVVEVPGASHCIRRDVPDTVTEALVAFCQSLRQ